MRVQIQDRDNSGLTLLELVVVVTILAFLSGLVTYNLTPNQITFAGAGGRKTAGRIATETSMGRIKDAIRGSTGVNGYWQDMNQDIWFWPWNLEWLARPPENPFNSFYDAASESYYHMMLAYDPNRRIGWRGPYLRFEGVVVPLDPAKGFTSVYGGLTGTRAPIDGWGGVIVMQFPIAPDGSTYDLSTARGDAVTTVLLTQNSRLVSAGPDGILQTELNRPFLRTHEDFMANPTLIGDDVVVWIMR